MSNCSKLPERAKQKKKELMKKWSSQKKQIRKHASLSSSSLAELILGGALTGGLLGGTAGGIFSPKGETQKGMLRGALAGAGVGALKLPIVDKLLMKNLRKAMETEGKVFNPKSILGGSLLSLAPLATTAGGIAGGTTPTTQWQKIKNRIGVNT